MKLEFLIVAVGLVAACSHTSGAVRGASPDPRFAACEAVLLEQAAAWNRGDMAGYAAAYHASDKTAFISGSGITLGYQALLERMKKHYPDKAAMGHLTFKGLAFRSLGKAEILVEGTWRLKRKEDSPWGRFVLVMRNVKAGWRVVLDYTNLQGKN